MPVAATPPRRHSRWTPNLKFSRVGWALPTILFHTRGVGGIGGIEVVFERKAGYFKETQNDAVMEKWIRRGTSSVFPF